MSQPAAPKKPGRPPVLDDIKKAQITALLNFGVSRANAAYYLGCSPNTINNTALRDEQFGLRCRQSEMFAEVELVQGIRAAGKNQWRAAAWLLERQLPQSYGGSLVRRMNRRHIGGLNQDLLNVWMKFVPEDQQEYVAAQIDEITSQYSGDRREFGTVEERQEATGSPVVDTPPIDADLACSMVYTDADRAQLCERVFDFGDPAGKQPDRPVTGDGQVALHRAAAVIERETKAARALHHQQQQARREQEQAAVQEIVPLAATDSTAGQDANDLAARTGRFDNAENEGRVFSLEHVCGGDLLAASRVEAGRDGLEIVAGGQGASLKRSFRPPRRASCITTPNARRLE